MIPDLSEYVAPHGTLVFEGIEKLRLNDYHVCQLIGPYILAATGWVERTDVLVRKVVVTPEHVRAYFPEPEADTLVPECIEIKLPKGLYERAVDLSAGPLSPFPVHGPTEEVKLFLGRLQQATFPEVTVETTKKSCSPPKHLIMNATNYGDVRKWLQARYDPCTTADELRTGFQGILWEHDSCTKPPPDAEDQGRSVKLWISRLVPIGTVWTSGSQPPPNWDPQKVQIHKLSEEGTP